MYQIPQTGQTHSNNSAIADELFACVWPFCRACAYRVNEINLYICKIHYIKRINRANSSKYFSGNESNVS